MGSPLLLVWQEPPKPLHNVLPALGPWTTLPDLSQISKEVLTHWTLLLGPTSPLVSGGRQPHPLVALLIPSKSTVGVGMSLWMNDRCTSGSRTNEVDLLIPAIGFSGASWRI